MTHVCQYFISKTHVWFLPLDFYTIRLTPTSIELHSFLHTDLHFSGVDVFVVGRSPTTTDIGNRLLFPWMMRKRWQFSPTNCAFFQLYKLFQWDSTFSPARLWKFSPRRGPTVCQTIDFERRSGPGPPDPTRRWCAAFFVGCFDIHPRMMRGKDDSVVPGTRSQKHQHEYFSTNDPTGEQQIKSLETKQIIEMKFYFDAIVDRRRRCCWAALLKA